MLQRSQPQNLKLNLLVSPCPYVRPSRRSTLCHSFRTAKIIFIKPGIDYPFRTKSYSQICPIGHCVYINDSTITTKNSGITTCKGKVNFKEFHWKFVTFLHFFLSKPDKNNAHFARGPIRLAALNPSWLPYVSESVKLFKSRVQGLKTKPRFKLGHK
jgi:hypothetical protein